MFFDPFNIRRICSTTQQYLIDKLVDRDYHPSLSGSGLSFDHNASNLETCFFLSGLKRKLVIFASKKVLSKKWSNE